VMADALIAAINAVDPEFGPLDQKLLTAKLMAELVHELENLGALLWAIRHRAKYGIVGRILDYQAKNASEMYEQLQAGTPVSELLNVPSAAQLAPHLDTDEDRAIWADGLENLQGILSNAAGIYLAENPHSIRSYNRVKHGFSVVVRRHVIPGTGAPVVDQPNDVNIITGMDASGDPIYEVLPRNEASISALRDFIQAYSHTYKEIVYVMLFLWERGIPITWDGHGRLPKR
jgi:hypothetical protein